MCYSTSCIKLILAQSTFLTLNTKAFTFRTPNLPRYVQKGTKYQKVSKKMDKIHNKLKDVRKLCLWRVIAAMNDRILLLSIFSKFKLLKSVLYYISKRPVSSNISLLVYLTIARLVRDSFIAWRLTFMDI